MDFSRYFKYDPSSPSGLVWAKNIYTGRARNILLYEIGTPCGSLHRDGHWSVAFRVNGRQVRRYCHRILWVLLYGEIDGNLTIDHINGDRADNAVCNLRLVSKRVNCRNKGMDSRNTSGKTGVSRVVVGKYSYAVASWITDQGVRHNKNFPIHSLGEDEAFRLASSYRDDMISQINENTTSLYTERHGK
ncbi:HNH homing endonuclease [Pseudomonas phage vB_PF_Y1-MI]|nr:HNH homing endonuclease [Pseudomonas phage vB_PF_Y1-MI]